MVDYLVELFDDANDFAWSSAKNCHESVCRKMEEGKLDWADTSGLERERRAHAQRIPSQKHEQEKHRSFDNRKIVPCSFYQTGACTGKDHGNSKVLYKHICITCFRKNKQLRHPDCKGAHKIE